MDVIPRFDVSVTGGDDAGPRLALGTVVAHPAGTTAAAAKSPRTGGPAFSVSLAALSRHVFIAGVTGSGKTNTSLQLLRGLHGKDVPFLVIEPAKREYRELAQEPGGDPPADVRPGLRCTPPRATRARRCASTRSRWRTERPSPSTWISCGRSSPPASATCGRPLPQVLEQCMLRAYRARGWDPAV